jgi:hypothetical protein
MMTGYWVSQSISVAARLGVADLLQDGPRTSDDLATACGAHAPSLYRLLRGLASVGIFQEVEDRRFALTSMATLLRSDVDGSMRALGEMYGREQYLAWGDAFHSIQTGQPAFDRVFGSSYFDYLAGHPEAGTVFDRAMSGWTTQVAAGVVAAYDFGDVGTVVDVGGGEGLLLATILRRFPATRGILFDLPHVVGRVIARSDRADVAGRWEATAGDFFRSVPVGGDVYLLAQILHDWDDDRSQAILAQCHRAMRPGARVLAVEQVIPPGNELSVGKWLDLHMLILLAGRERTQDEYRTLYAAAGFELTRVIPTASGASIVEGVRV